MKKIEFNVKEPYLNFIKLGKKTIEGRLNKGKFKQIKVGDVLILSDGSKMEFVVIGKRSYSSFSEMLIKENIKNVIPDKNDLEEAIQVYYKFYTPEQENKLGVVAIEIKLKEI